MRHLLGLLGLIALGGCAAPAAEDGEMPEPVSEELDSIEAAEPEAPAFELTHPERSFALPNDLVFAIPAERPFLVVRAPSESLAASEPIELVSEPSDLSGVLASYRALRSDELPELDRALIESGHAGRYVLFDDQGEACRVQIDEIGLLRRNDEAWSWNQEEPPFGADPKQRAWEMGESGELLVLRTHAVQGACGSARWGLPEARRTPDVWRRSEKVPVKLAMAARAELRRLPEWTELQDVFSEDQEHPHGGLWDEYDVAAWSATLWHGSANQADLILVGATSGNVCGGDFEGSLWALFQLMPHGFVTRAVGTGATVPDHVLDVEGDGDLELFTGDSVTFTEDGERRTLGIEVPGFHCPC